jgi:N-acetylmuramoyl-L-alanine amidase
MGGRGRTWLGTYFFIKNNSLISNATGCARLCFALLASIYCMPASFAAGTGPEVDGAKVVVTSTETIFSLSMTQGVTAEVFTLADPFRVVIDLPKVAFRLADGSGQNVQGLINAFRYGQFAAGQGRIVIDTKGPVRITKAEMTAKPESGVVFDIALQGVTRAAFGNGTGSADNNRDTSKAAPEAALAGGPKPTAETSNATTAALPSKPAASKPIILIDPGHGGIDGGAVSSLKLLEKNVVLAVGKELKKQLSQRGQYDVRLTRTGDTFVSLDKRLKASRDVGADLFISLHADSIEDQAAAHSIRGATVYTLSERASDEQARQMAEKENASDLIAGLSASSTEKDNDVKGILIDLMKRETANYSADFSKTLVSTMKRNVKMASVPQRSAAFKVLKQTHAPSVLVELGYMTHSEDQKLLSSPDWQRGAATSIAEAVDQFFSKRPATASARP